MSSVIVDTAYLVHSKGSKFYEVISFNNLDNGRRAIMRRWGITTASAINGGGTIKFEPYEGILSLKAAFDSAVVDKRKRGYALAHSGHGFHNHKKEVNPFTESLLRCHYSNIADVGIIMSGLGLKMECSDLFEQEYDMGLVDDINDEEIIEEGLPVKELERGADWESW
jgi:hypothetical protein